jgi:hypothetical protein
VRAADATPVGGTFWILKIAHALSPKNLSKNGFCPRKGGGLSTENVFAKKFQVREQIALSALAFGCSHANRNPPLIGALSGRPSILKRGALVANPALCPDALAGFLLGDRVRPSRPHWLDFPLLAP